MPLVNPVPLGQGGLKKKPLSTGGGWLRDLRDASVPEAPALLTSEATDAWSPKHPVNILWAIAVLMRRAYSLGALVRLFL